MTDIELGTGQVRQVVEQPIVQSLTKTVKPRKEPESQFKFEIPTIKYDKLIGMKRPKSILYKYLVAPIIHEERFKDLNIKKSIGILFYGAPGTGKTFLVKAICGEYGIKMCYIEGNKIKDKYVGESGKNVAELFNAATKEQPCVIFIDEADNLLVDRDKIGGEGGGQEQKDVITAFLTGMSKVHDDPNSHIYTLGATNRPWDIDPAEKRSGRFTHTIYIESPNFWDRRKLFKMYLTDVKDKKELGQINYTLLSWATTRYSAPDIWKVCDAAKRNVAEKLKAKITTRSVQRVLWRKDTGKSSLDEFYLTAYHKYLPENKSLIKSMVSQSYKKKPAREGKFDKADMELYADMVTDVRNYMRYKWMMRILRVLGKGIPNYW